METHDNSDDELDFTLNTEWDAIIRDDDFVDLLCERLEEEQLSGYSSEADSFPVAFGCSFVWMQAEAKLAGGRAGVGAQGHTGRARKEK